MAKERCSRVLPRITHEHTGTRQNLCACACARCTRANAGVTSQRDPLVRLSREKPHLALASYTKNQAHQTKEDFLGLEPSPEITLEEHCQYRFLFNFRGVAASFR